MINIIDILKKALIGKPIRVCTTRNIILTTNSFGDNPYAKIKRLGFIYTFEDTVITDVFIQHIDRNKYIGDNICLLLANGRICRYEDSINNIPFCLELMQCSNYTKDKYFLVCDR
jgi:hypothetical protein